MKLFALSLASCLCICAQQASLEGVTVDAATQMPLAGVHVSLISMGAGTNLAEPDDAYGAISDAAGRYSIGSIRPGTYILAPKHAGYVYVREKDAAAAPMLALKPGEQNAGYRIVMTPETTILGRVIDEFGDPVQGVAIEAIPAGVRPYGLWMRGETDDRGEYRISGIPGKYFIQASVPPLDNSGAREIRTDGSSSTPYATTYYPGALAIERAKAVDAAAAQEVAGIDIHVAHRKSLKITGVVTGIPAQARAEVAISVLYDGRQASDFTQTGVDGRFAFEGLAPGEYVVEARYPSGDAGGDPLRSAFVKVTIENEDAAVTLPVSAGDSIAGTLQVEGELAGKASGEKWTVRLIPADWYGMETKGGEVAPDGSFTIGKIIPGKFRLTVDPLPENTYIGSVLVGGADAIDGELDFSKGVNGSTVKVIVSRNGGQIAGAVADKAGQRVMGRHLFVVLAADLDSFATWRTAGSSGPSDSTFVIHGIRPGKYRLFAVDPAQFGGLRDYEPLKAIAARAEEIEIKEGDRIVKELRLAEKEDAGAK